MTEERAEEVIQKFRDFLEIYKATDYKVDKMVSYDKNMLSEYDYMWESLAKSDINKGDEIPQFCFNENAGEAWQYMGTHFITNRVVHQFRHRCHPKTVKREYINIPVSSIFKAYCNSTNSD